jgi:very-long-chain enoyl-CoA reductase
MCHIELSSFRKKAAKPKTDAGTYVNPTKVRGIPKGWGFSLVSCANYFWESLGWIIFCILSRSYTVYFFTACSIYQMLEWALKKHKQYKKEFPDYPRGRKAMFPFII